MPRAPAARRWPWGSGEAHQSALWWLPLVTALIALLWLAPTSDSRAQGPAPSPAARLPTAVTSAGRAPGAAGATTQPPGTGPIGAPAQPTALEDGGADGQAAEPEEDAAPLDPAVAALLERAARVRDLLTGELEPSVDPLTLFDVDLTDQQAVLIEARRLRALIDAVDAPVGEPDGGIDAAAAAGSVARAAGLTPAPAAGRGDAGTGSDASDDAATAMDGGSASEEPVLSEELWRAHLALDRARLAFYELPAAERQARLEEHAERVRASKEAEQQRQLSKADEKGRHAAAEREKALEAMRLARTEATRLVAEERARLLGVEEQQASFERELIVLEHGFDARQEALLAWRRRVAEATAPVAPGQEPPFDVARADRTYDELRLQLRADRRALDDALSAVAGAPSAVPAAGPDPLAELPADVDRSELDRVRAKVLETERALREREAALRAANARQFMEEVATLNRHRLALLPVLSAPKRAELVGFGAVGRDQARAEVSQVVLVLRFQQWATTRALADYWRRGKLGRSALGLTPLALLWLVPIVGFVWWRRRAPKAIDAWRTLAQQAHERRTRSKTPSRKARAIDFVGRVRKPVEWLLLLGAAVLLVPEAARQRLEAQILGEVLLWSFGAMLVIGLVDALSSHQPPASGKTDPGPLRLRSLRLVGLVVVGVALALRLAAQLVGEGTIYTWVFRTGWLAAIPIALVLVAWWRPIIFERLASRRRKSTVAAWVTARQDRWSSFFVAAVGGVYLVVSRIVRAVRRYVGGFDLTRRALAYWFRRGIAKQTAAGTPQQELGPLPESAMLALDPESPSATHVPSVADEQVRSIVGLIDAHGGGLFAVVGERGSGKSSILRRIAAEGPEVTYVQCPHGGLDALRALLGTTLGLGPGAHFAEIRALLDRGEQDHGLVIDDAHRLLRPEIGGLDELDALLDFARTASASCTWVLALDAAIWQLYERGRGARPAFDDVIEIGGWSESEIAELLRSRSREARLEPSYELVMPPLPERADELEREDARMSARASYVRLIWDHAGGNPGVALQLWRDSLRTSPEGRLLVQLFAVPSATDLESLPDEAVFVLRAVLQLDQARTEDLCAATTLSPSEVASALRYGVARGYFERQGDRHRIAWPWFRTITRFLERRHLLATAKRRP